MKFNCRFVYPILINTTKWKFAYIIFKKIFVNFYLDCELVNFKQNSDITFCALVRKNRKLCWL